MKRVVDEDEDENEDNDKIDSKNGNKNIWLLGTSSLFNDAGSDTITAILPFFITALGGNGAAVGALSGLREGLASLFKLLGGWYSDRIGKRMPFVFFGYLVSTIFRFLIALSISWQYVITFVSIERIGKTRDAPRDAIIATSTQNRGRGFAIHQMMDTVGGIIGASLALLFFWKFSMDFSKIIIFAGIISSLSLIPLFFVKENKFRSKKFNLFTGIKDLSKKLKYLVFVIAIFALADFGLYMFIILRAKELTGSIIIALMLGILFNLTCALFAMPFGNLSDKVGRKKVLLAGIVLFTIVSLGFVYAQTLLLLIPLFIFYGLSRSMTLGIQKAFVSDFAGEMKGTAMGFYYFVIGLVNIAGGVIAGLLWDIKPSIMFSYLVGIALLSIVFMMFVKE